MAEDEAAMNPADLERRFLELIERNEARIFRVCRAWARHPADFEDLRSEVLLQLWRSLPSFDGRSAEDTWLFRVALNVAMLFRRRERGRRERLDLFRRRAPEHDAAPDPSARVDRRDRLDRLTAAIAGLDPTDRAMVTLQLEDLSYAQIAEVTGLGESHVGVRLHRIRKKLAQAMTEDEEVRDARP